MIYIKKRIDLKAQMWIVNQAPHHVKVMKGTTIGQVIKESNLEEQMEDIKVMQKMMSDVSQHTYNGKAIPIPEMILPINPEIIQQINKLDLSIV